MSVIQNKNKIDNETTIVNMNIEGMPGYHKDNHTKKMQNGVSVTKRERRAMIFGALHTLLPFIGMILIVFLVLYTLLYLWLN